jgi:hypothetical protein
MQMLDRHSPGPSNTKGSANIGRQSAVEKTEHLLWSPGHGPCKYVTAAVVRAIVVKGLVVVRCVITGDPVRRDVVVRGPACVVVVVVESPGSVFAIVGSKRPQNSDMG